MSKKLVDQTKLKQHLIKVLQIVGDISSAAAVVNPIFGLAGKLIHVVVSHVDNEDIGKLKSQFGAINKDLEEISKQIHDTLMDIQKDTLDKQYRKVEGSLRNQFRKFMDMVEDPEQQEEFMKCCASEAFDKNLHTLYDGVVGTKKLFSQPILELYLKHSQGNRATMENLCSWLTYLFCIGLIALMGYAAIAGKDVERLKGEWDQRMVDVQEKMQEALQMCK